MTARIQIARPATSGATSAPGRTRLELRDALRPVRALLLADHWEAGATSWVEAVHPWRYGYPDRGGWPMGAMLERIQAGP